MQLSPTSGQQSLIPVNDCILVELSQSFSNVRTKDGKYQAYTEGICKVTPDYNLLGKVKEPRNDLEYLTKIDILLGKRVFFEEYKEGGHIRREGKEYAFVKVEDVRGYEDVT